MSGSKGCSPSPSRKSDGPMGLGKVLGWELHGISHGFA